MEFVKFIVNLYTCNMYYSILSSELLSNVFFLFSQMHLSVKL